MKPISDVRCLQQSLELDIGEGKAQSSFLIYS